MRWTKKDKPIKPKKVYKSGDRKIKKHFCLFPKSSYNKGITTYYWLESVYVVSEFYEGLLEDHWFEVDITPSYEEALTLTEQRRWEL